jgi:hypothetical protein
MGTWSSGRRVTAIYWQTTGWRIAFGTEDLEYKTMSDDGIRRPVGSTTVSSQLPALRREGAIAVGAVAVGALAVGAVAIGALAIGKLAVGQLVLGRTKLRRGQVDDMVIARLTIRELTIERVR